MDHVVFPLAFSPLSPSFSLRVLFLCKMEGSSGGSFPFPPLSSSSSSSSLVAENPEKNYEELVKGVYLILQRQLKQAQSDIQSLLALKAQALEDPVSFLQAISSQVSSSCSVCFPPSVSDLRWFFFLLSFLLFHFLSR